MAPRAPDPEEFEGMAEHIVAAGYYSSRELADASNSERAQLRTVLAGGNGGGARLLRKVLGAKAPPTEAEIEKASPLKEMNIFFAIKTCRASLRCLGASGAPDKRL